MEIIGHKFGVGDEYPVISIGDNGVVEGCYIKLRSAACFFMQPDTVVHHQDVIAVAVTMTEKEVVGVCSQPVLYTLIKPGSAIGAFDGPPHDANKIRSTLIQDFPVIAFCNNRNVIAHSLEVLAMFNHAPNRTGVSLDLSDSDDGSQCGRSL